MRIYFIAIASLALGWSAHGEPTKLGDAGQVRYELDKSDLNGDGFLSFDERYPEQDVIWFKDSLPTESYEILRESHRDAFGKADLNHDGLLDYEELVAVRTAFLDEHFDALDKNADKQISIGEYMQMDEIMLSGHVLVWAFAESSFQQDKLKNDEAPATSLAVMQAWGQNTDAPAAPVNRTPDIWVRMGIEFGELDLNSDTVISLTEYRQNGLGIMRKSSVVSKMLDGESQTND